MKLPGSCTLLHMQRGTPHMVGQCALSQVKPPTKASPPPPVQQPPHVTGSIHPQSGNSSTHLDPGHRQPANATKHRSIVQEYPEREEHLGRIQHVSSKEAFLPSLQISPFGVIPKCNQPDKWCLIVKFSVSHNQCQRCHK